MYIPSSHGSLTIYKVDFTLKKVELRLNKTYIREIILETYTFDISQCLIQMVMSTLTSRTSHIKPKYNEWSKDTFVEYKNTKVYSCI